MRISTVLASAAALSLMSCGGGSGGGGSSGGGDSAPSVQILSPADISVAEDRLSAVELSLANGAGATFSISGGADSALFRQEGNTFSFRGPMSFETPRDANRDNVYEVEIMVRANGTTDRQLFRITITNSKEGVAVTRAATFGTEIAAATLHFGDLMIAASRGGQLFEYQLANDAVVDRGRLFGVDGTTTTIEAIGTFDDGVGGYDVLAYVRKGGATGRTVETWFYADGTNRAPRVIDSVTFASADLVHVSAERDLVAYGDNGQPLAAQNDGSKFGKAYVLMRDYSAASTTSVRLLGRGLRLPIVSYDNTRYPLLTDEGQASRELNGMLQAFFDINFEWPVKDGFEDTGVSGVSLAGERSPPLHAVARSSQDDRSTRWIGAAASRFVTMDSDYIVVRADGSVLAFTDYYERPVGDRAENRTADFAPDTGRIDRPVMVGLANDPVSGAMYALPVIVDGDGDIFLVGGTS
ncbi:hypothetical protein WJS89_06015 [Sphingomicrobium sp. XHP0235]|uniref:hypothetical protein n=1 Tax=Sphingomicrobium aquimarinum TaxID=3133971 RepID=UPI0031FE533B